VRLLLESASLATLPAAVEARLIDGAFVSPAALDRDAFGIEPVDQVAAVLRRVSVPVYAVAGAVVADDLYALGRDLARLDDSLTVVLPCVEDGLAALRQLAADGVRTAAAFVVTPAQALLAVKSGASAVVLAADVLAGAGHDAAPVIADTAALFARHGLPADLLVATGGQPRLAAEALAQGADAAIVHPDTLAALRSHPLTDRALDQMLGELSRRPRPRLA
jgi:transaldolase